MKKFKLIIALIAITTLASCNDKTTRQAQYMPDMYESVPYDADGANGLKGAPVNSKPVAGTIPRGGAPAYDIPDTIDGYEKAKTALKSPLEKNEKNLENGKKMFSNEIKNGRYELLLDDSSNIKKYIVNNFFKNNRTIFFLDAHVDNSNIRNYKQRCPLFDELEAISLIGRNDNIILIDDLRIITKSFPWGEKDYGNINFLEQIKNKILSINNDYKFDTLDGHVKNDVLIAYI